MQWGMYHTEGGVCVRKPTVYEWTVLILSTTFLIICAVWLTNQTAPSPEWLVQTERFDTSLSRPADARHPADGLLEGEIIDLNRATRSDLLRLPDIGSVRAAAILAYRDRYGPFQSVDDLLNVFGIGPATLEQLRPYICAG